MDSLNHDNQADVIEAFNSTSRYLDDLLNIDNPYFEYTFNQIYPPELQLNKANNIDTEVPFWIYIFLLQMDLFRLRFMINAMTLILIYYSKFSRFLDGDVPRRASYGVFISQLC